MEWLNEIGNEDQYEDLPQFETSVDDIEIQWRKERLGMITGSNFGKLVVQTKDRKGYTLSKGVTAENLIYKIAWERLLKQGDVSNGLGRLNISSREMEHGLDYEGPAVKLYMERTGNHVDYVQQFIQKDDFIGGTPDGFIGEDGLIEVKAPWNGGNHLKSLLTGEIYNSDYIYQIQGYLWVTDRNWCDFITYDPDLIDELKINIIRVERDEIIIDGIKQVMDMVKEKIQIILNHEKLLNGSLEAN